MRLLLPAFFAAFFLHAAAASAQDSVDLELVLAVDVSRSMDFEELQIQRRGYAEAFRSAEVLQTITAGRHGRIAVTYVEWAGNAINRVIAPWTMIDGPDSAQRFSDQLLSQSPERLSRTSISGALEFSTALFGISPFKSPRQVIDISGDGPNNQGTPVELARDEVIRAGITINGLPLMVRPSNFGFGIDNLDEYYRDCVVGGVSAFVMPVTSWEEFPRALRRKLILEIAGLPPPAPLLHRAAIRVQLREKVDCFIGEKLWEERMRDMEWR